jgi:hypothetical protein
MTGFQKQCHIYEVVIVKFYQGTPSFAKFSSVGEEMNE